jgi:hypothetical protein
MRVNILDGRQRHIQSNVEPERNPVVVVVGVVIVVVVGIVVVVVIVVPVVIMVVVVGVVIVVIVIWREGEAIRTKGLLGTRTIQSH